MTRRADHIATKSQRLRSVRYLQRPAPLPDAVYRQLVDIIFGMSLPVAAMGFAFVAVGALIVSEWRDGIVAALSIAAAIVTLMRLTVIRGYHRGDRRLRSLADVRCWERRYAAGNYAFAILLGLLNVRMLMFHYPLVNMIAVSLVFAFGAGVVSRISVRPVICITSLLLAVVPTACALAIHAFGTADVPLHAQLYAIEALLTTVTAALSLQSVHHLYRSTVHHLVVSRDLALLAKQDALTGLPNRLLLREKFQDYVAWNASSGTTSMLAVHFLDLDGFKGVNDLHGHQAGDAVLCEVARRLLATIRPGDTVARLGGDEFVVIQAALRHRDEAEMLARRIIRQLGLPYEVDGKEVEISVSVGIALTPKEEWDLDRLIVCADAALYRAKRAGTGQLHFCTSEDERIAFDDAA